MLEIRPSYLQVCLAGEFSLYCYYAGETILEVLYRVVASVPFNTG